MIAEVYLFTNGMVMVFDREGRQVPGLQGKLAEVQSKVLERAPPLARFFLGHWGTTERVRVEVPRDLWSCFRYDHARMDALAEGKS